MNKSPYSESRFADNRESSEQVFAEAADGGLLTRNAGVDSVNIGKSQLRRTLVSIFALFLCLSLGAAISCWLGQDANWDLWNYHLYNGFSALHGRYNYDLAAASLQSWLNPTPDIAYSWLALGPLSQHPIILTALMGLWYGSLIFVVLMLAVVGYRHFPADQRWLATGFATILAVTGAAVFSQVGTTTNDLQASTLVMAAALLLVRAVEWENNRGTPDNGVLVFAGALLGMAAGAKFSYAIYMLAALVALVATVPRDRLVRTSLWVCAGALLGSIVTEGWWASILYSRFHNPLFPYFNSIFRSPWYPLASIFDRRFFPRDFWQLLFYPLYWLGDKPMLVIEVPFRDGRMAVWLAAASFLAAPALVRLPKTRTNPVGGWETRITPAQRFLFVFLVGSYVLWLNTTAILRYAIPIEVSAGLTLPLLIWRLARPTLSEKRARFWKAAVSIASVALLLTTHYPQLGRIGYGNRVVTADMRWLPAGSLVVFVGATSSYLAAFAPQDRSIGFLGLTDVVLEARGFRLADEIVKRIWTHKGPIILVLAKDERWRLPTLPEVGLALIKGSCRTFSSTYGNSGLRWFETCNAQKHVAGNLTSPFWKEAASRYEEIDVPRPVTGWSYIGFVQAVGRLARGKHFVDGFEYLWSRQQNRPKQFGEKIMPNALYILDRSVEARARGAMNSDTDLLARINGILVLAPGWNKTISAGTSGASGKK